MISYSYKSVIQTESIDWSERIYLVLL